MAQPSAPCQIPTIQQNCNTISVLMNPTQTNSRESRQAAIDAEIKSLEVSIRSLKLRRNTLQPISSLPPEIFAAIFSSLCLPGIQSLGGDPDRNQARLCVSHVCHQWREIALNQPQLWSHINFNAVNLAGATEILFRANLVPLYMETRVYGRHDYGRFGLFLKEVQARLPYIRHVSIEAESFGIIRQRLKNALVSPAPTLEYLSLCFQRVYVPMTDQLHVLNTLFGGSTPSLSCLKLRNCNISWNSPLFKSLKYLEIYTPDKMARPTLTVWLDTLDEIPQLKTLTLHSASPVAAHFPFDIERTVTLPSLTHLDISGSLPDCALAAAHLDLPALTSLCLTAIDPHTNGRGVQKFLPYVVRHVYGPQDIQPLQSVLIRSCYGYLELLAWPVPNIDTFVHDLPAFLGMIPPTRVKLSFWSSANDYECIETMMAALPLDSLLTLVAENLDRGFFCGEFTWSTFWRIFLPNWPLLLRVRLGLETSSAFMEALLVDCKDPLLPSLKELALAQTTLDIHLTRDALMKRVEQGVPLKTLDLRMCRRDCYTEAVQSLSEIAIDILGPEDTEESVTQVSHVAKMKTMWKPLLPYVSSDSAGDYNDDSYNEDDDGEGI